MYLRNLLVSSRWYDLSFSKNLLTKPTLLKMLGLELHKYFLSQWFSYTNLNWQAHHLYPSSALYLLSWLPLLFLNFFKITFAYFFWCKKHLILHSLIPFLGNKPSFLDMKSQIHSWCMPWIWPIQLYLILSPINHIHIGMEWFFHAFLNLLHTFLVVICICWILVWWE